MTRTVEPATKRPAHQRDPSPTEPVADEVEDDASEPEELVAEPEPPEPELEPEILEPEPEPVLLEPEPEPEPEPVVLPTALPPGQRPPSIRAARALLAQPPAPAAPVRTRPAPRVRHARPRARPVPRDQGVPYRPTRWWQRLRSFVALTTVSVILGLLAAAAIGIAMVALFSLLRSAVG